MNGVLIHTINKTESITEVYFHPNEEKITEIKYLNYNRVKKYTYPLTKFITDTACEDLKSKISTYGAENDTKPHLENVVKTLQKNTEMDKYSNRTDFIKPLGYRLCPI